MTHADIVEYLETYVFPALESENPNVPGAISALEQLCQKLAPK